MEVALIAFIAFVQLVAIFGAVATIYGEESRDGFAPYAAGG